MVGDRGAAIHQKESTRADAQVVLALISCADSVEASAIASVLLERRLVAAVNLLPGVTSFFRWQGSTQSRDEVLLIAKTRAGHADRIVSIVTELHSYDLPSIVFTTLTAGHTAYLEWILAETSDPQSDF